MLTKKASTMHALSISWHSKYSSQTLECTSLLIISDDLNITTTHNNRLKFCSTQEWVQFLGQNLIWLLRANRYFNLLYSYESFYAFFTFLKQFTIKQLFVVESRGTGASRLPNKPGEAHPDFSTIAEHVYPSIWKFVWTKMSIMHSSVQVSKVD